MKITKNSKGKSIFDSFVKLIIGNKKYFYFDISISIILFFLFLEFKNDYFLACSILFFVPLRIIEYPKINDYYRYYYRYGLYYASFLFIVLKTTTHYFPIILVFSLLVLIFILKDPTTFFYFLAGKRNSLKVFILSYIFAQLIFLYIYSEYFPDASIHELFSNTFFTAIGNQPMGVFQEKIFSKSSNLDKSIDKYRHFGLIVYTQIVLSWVYLGLLISSIYQKFRRE